MLPWFIVIPEKRQILTLIQSGRFVEARSVCEPLCRKHENDAEAWFLLGAINGQLGAFPEAEACCLRAIAINPGVPTLHYNLGVARLKQGRATEAAANFVKALELKNDLVEAHHDLGNALCVDGRLDMGIESYRRAIALKPDFADAHNNLGLALQEQSRWSEAVGSYRRVLSINPRRADAYNNLGTALQHLGDIEQAVAMYRRALELDPHFTNAHSNLLFALNYSSSLSNADLYMEHCQWGDRHARHAMEKALPNKNERSPERRLRVGYVSPDFRSHSVAYFIEPILAAHDRAKFEIFCYAHVARPDVVTDRLRTLCDHWRDIVTLSDAEAADLIRSDGIDILVDLSGHTGNNRLMVFAHRPAPVQVTYLGYPNTTGMPAMHYRVTDAWADSPGEIDRFYSETLVRLPECFLCYSPPSNSPLTKEQPAKVAGHITFGSFNNCMKLTAEVAALWGQILRATPGARLLLKSRQFGAEEVRQWYHDLFAREGIAPGQVEMMSFAPEDTHLTLYNKVDIALDPFPYNGTTTTCEALWMGVPVITLAGTRHSGRVGVSLLSSAGVPELVAGTVAEYCEKAVALASDMDRLEFYRKNLRDMMQRSPLMDRKQFTSSLESAYRWMWRTWCETDPQ